MCPRSRPERTCTGCGGKKDKRDLVRIVAAPDGDLVPDLKGRLPVRGAYVCPRRQCIERAAAGRLGYSLKLPRTFRVDGEMLAQRLADMYAERFLALLGLAQKGGNVVSGTNLVEAEMRRYRGGWLGIVARDASLDATAGARKLMEKLDRPVMVFGTRAELGDAIGKSPRSAVLVKNPGIAQELAGILDLYVSVVDKGGLIQ